MILVQSHWLLSKACLQQLACRDCGFKSHGERLSVFYEYCVLGGRGLCVGPITCPKESLVCLWLWSLNNEVVVHWWLLHHEKDRVLILKLRVMIHSCKADNFRPFSWQWNIYCLLGCVVYSILFKCHNIRLNCCCKTHGTEINQDSICQVLSTEMCSVVTYV